MGPVEYAAGVQEITLALGTVDASVISVDATLVGGFASSVAATAAAGTAVSATVGAEAASTRNTITTLLRQLFPIIPWAVGEDISLGFVDPVFSTISYRRVSGGLTPYIVYGATYLVSQSGSGSVSFIPTRISPDNNLCGPRRFEFFNLRIAAVDYIAFVFSV